MRNSDISAALLRLQTWLSPAFPTGSFSYSHGLETLVAQGKVSNREEFGTWLSGIFHHGNGWNDALLLTDAWCAAENDDSDRFADTNNLALAMQPSKERLLETMAQGNAFNRAVRAWDAAADLPFDSVTLPVATGWHCGRHGIALDLALVAYANAFLSNLVWIAVRIIPLGQSEGLALIARMEPDILALCEKAQNATLDDLGSFTLTGDIASMRHETLQTRIFRS